MNYWLAFATKCICATENPIKRHFSCVITVATVWYKHFSFATVNFCCLLSLIYYYANMASTISENTLLLFGFTTGNYAQQEKGGPPTEAAYWLPWFTKVLLSLRVPWLGQIASGFLLDWHPNPNQLSITDAAWRPLLWGGLHDPHLSHCASIQKIP